MIKEAIISESISLVYAIANKQLKKIKLELNNDKSDIGNSLNHHIRIVKNWSSEVIFKDLKSSKKTSQIFIPLDLYVYPKKIRVDSEEKINTIPLLKVIGNELNHVAILGQPGAGKTTSIKFICQSIFFDENFYPTQFKYPILIRLREFNHPLKDKNSAGILFEHLFSLFGLDIKDSPDAAHVEKIIRAKKNLSLEILDKLKVLLVIDGFDELTFKSHREIVIKEVGEIANYLENSKLIITSRSADYNSTNENISLYEICPLNEQQIVCFAQKWLGKTNATRFIEEVKKSPYDDTSIRPLTIAHLCAIYERIGKIPDKPKTVYRKIVNLLIEEWDEERGIKRDSKYALFEIDRKFEFLCNLSYHLTIKNGKSIFSKRDLTNVYVEIYSDFDLEISDSSDVILDIESHTGLFVQAGYEFYEFAHKSIQEYLTAEYIVKLPTIPNNKRLIQRLPNELAITITISSNPSAYFIELVNNILLKMKLSFDFIQKFINRLVLEKPEFYKNSKVGLSALLLYSNYMSQKTRETLQLSLFNSDFLIGEFEELIDSIFRRNSKETILAIYDIEHTFETINQTKVHILKKKNEEAWIIDDKYSDYKTLLEFPQFLHCRQSFLK
ncbi:NACHT domain-containing protein [Allomuricauda taeanensis]|uniref:NACHT domain-containing protein n=1 Tax=Flagellimonas taeanensis TaxID=1005926 RepID=UPI002E7BDFF0|nr:NACHT domain-containing protein [Allomuricauda taeanensis]MEE1962040.1 NACHT domain-containing protein [Allomuricauda taeanensis]